MPRASMPTMKTVCMVASSRPTAVCECERGERGERREERERGEGGRRNGKRAMMTGSEGGSLRERGNRTRTGGRPGWRGRTSSAESAYPRGDETSE